VAARALLIRWPASDDRSRAERVRRNGFRHSRTPLYRPHQPTLATGDDASWLTENKAAGKLADEMKQLGVGQYSVLFDSIDDHWEGTEESLVYLTAFMHACLETSSRIPWARALLFLRENIFERVRARDSESSRLETAVVGMNWSPAQLLELVERRLNRTFNTKFALGGATWDAWFERPTDARSDLYLLSTAAARRTHLH
jgi:hypothetical protein